MTDRRYTSRERVLHKLTGAAYQATHEDEYQLAVEICGMVIQFADRTGDNDIIHEPEADSDSQESASGVEDVSLPGRDTAAYKAVIGLLQCHQEGKVWVSRMDVKSLYDGGVADALYGLRDRYRVVQWRRENGAIEFRIDPRHRDAVVDMVMNDD